MPDLMPYAGLIEVMFIFSAVVLFVIWQMRTLKRDIRAREERERREAAARDGESKNIPDTAD